MNNNNLFQIRFSILTAFFFEEALALQVRENENEEAVQVSSKKPNKSGNIQGTFNMNSL